MRPARPTKPPAATWPASDPLVEVGDVEAPVAEPLLEDGPDSLLELEEPLPDGLLVVEEAL